MRKPVIILAMSLALAAAGCSTTADRPARVWPHVVHCPGLGSQNQITPLKLILEAKNRELDALKKKSSAAGPSYPEAVKISHLEKERQQLLAEISRLEQERARQLEDIRNLEQSVGVLSTL